MVDMASRKKQDGGTKRDASSWKNGRSFVFRVLFAMLLCKEVFNVFFSTGGCLQLINLYESEGETSSKPNADSVNTSSIQASNVVKPVTEPVVVAKTLPAGPVCNGHGSMLMDTCFCHVGYTTASNCTEHTPIPPCGPYDDRCFFHPSYGVAIVSQERWKGAQAHEDATWAEQRTSDRNDQHIVNFGSYAALVLQDAAAGKIRRAADKTALGNMLEVGAGPFSQSLSIMEATGLRPQSITLLEPLAETYMKTVNACRYKDGKLTNGKDITIDETIILPIPAEEFNVDGTKDGFYDTVVLLNMIEHVQDAFLIYSKALDALKPGGIAVFHERFWPGYTGQETRNKREFDLHPIRLNDKFAHWMSTEFDLLYEREQKEVWGNIGYYWIGRKRENSMASSMNKLAANMKAHADFLKARNFDENNIWGNIYNGQDLEQPREYMSYASLPWVKTICELGFAGGHSTVTYLTANPSAKIYSFDDMARKDLGTTAYNRLKESIDITLTVGDSTQAIPKFTRANPNVYCDIISVDGAHHAHFPDHDLNNFKYMANYPNVVLIDDFHRKDWPAVTTGVDNRVKEGSLKIRHVAASTIIFRQKQKQWAIGEYTLLTVIIASIDPARAQNLGKLVGVASSHPAVQKVVVLWNTPDVPIPDEVNAMAHTPGAASNKKSRIEIVQGPSTSLNNRYDPSLSIHTGAVMILDDDVIINHSTITCALNAYKADPSRVYSFGLPRRVTTSGYDDIPPHNFLLPRMIFHKSFMGVYYQSEYDALRNYVNTQKGHCDDILFASIATRHTGKPLVKIDAYMEDRVDLALQGLTSSPSRGDDRKECAQHILQSLQWDLPTIAVSTCAAVATKATVAQPI